MVHLSKNYLDKIKLKKLYLLFFEVISKSSGMDGFLSVINDFISPTEQIMLAKRIAIIYLLVKGLSPTEISGYLMVSQSTISKFYLLFYEKRSTSIQIISSLLKKGKIRGFIEDIFSDLFIQPGLQKGHWQLKKMFDKSKSDRRMLDIE